MSFADSSDSKFTAGRAISFVSLNTRTMSCKQVILLYLTGAIFSKYISLEQLQAVWLHIQHARIAVLALNYWMANRPFHRLIHHGSPLVSYTPTGERWQIYTALDQYWTQIPSNRHTSLNHPAHLIVPLHHRLWANRPGSQPEKHQHRQRSLSTD